MLNSAVRTAGDKTVSFRSSHTHTRASHSRQIRRTAVPDPDRQVSHTCAIATWSQTRSLGFTFLKTRLLTRFTHHRSLPSPPPLPPTSYLPSYLHSPFLLLAHES